MILKIFENLLKKKKKKIAKFTGIFFPEKPNPFLSFVFFMHWLNFTVGEPYSETHLICPTVPKL